MRYWKKIALTIVSLLFSLIGARIARAIPSTSLSQDEVPPTYANRVPSRSPETISQACPESWQRRQRYAKVVTQRTPLLIRATPGGRIIGSVPKGWNVVVLERSSNGAWTRITHHFADPAYPSSHFPIFGTAPDLQEGWVSTQYLRDLGDFCKKPLVQITTQLLASSNAQQYITQEDWVNIGDRITLNSQQE